MKNDDLTDKERMFIAEYCKDFNGTRAAKAAGYSEKSASIISFENLRKPKIMKNIRRYVDDILDIDKISLKHDVIERLKLIAFNDPEEKLDREGAVIDISFRDNLSALDKLGKYLTIYEEKIEHIHSGSVDMKMVSISDIVGTEEV